MHSSDWAAWLIGIGGAIAAIAAIPLSSARRKLVGICVLCLIGSAVVAIASEMHSPSSQSPPVTSSGNYVPPINQPTVAETTTTDSPSPTEAPPATSDATTDAATDAPSPRAMPTLGTPVEVSPSLQPQYLSDLGIVSTGGSASPQTGKSTIDGHSYPNSVYICSDMEAFPNIYCDSDGSSSWADFNIPAGYGIFQTTVGFSGRSPSNCDVTAKILVDGTEIFSRELHYGDSIPLKQSVSGKLRVRLEIVPVTGQVCNTVFGDAVYGP